jgi:cation diffusion facilitator family transporter
MNAADSSAEVVRAKVRAARLSILSNTTLVLLKLVAGILSGSVSVVSEALHSASDLLASWIAFFSVRISDRPADSDHPYGHGKIESISGLAEALLIFGAAGYIVYEAVRKLIVRAPVEHLEAGIAVMGVSAVANLLVARYLFRVARQTDSLALEADGEHLRTDVITSAGVMVGLFLARITGWHVLDPLVAMVVALVIIHAAWRLSRSAMGPLLDRQLPDEDLNVVRGVLETATGVRGYHKLRSRKSGASRHIDAHVMMDDDLTLLDAHELTERIEDDIRRQLPNVEISLHTEPFEAEERHQFESHGGPPPKPRKMRSKDRSPSGA